jgi:DNA repair ATPase RecN
MNVRLNVAILVVVASPIFAQAQEPSIARMKEDAQKVVKIITSDKSKTHTYCDLVKLSNQIEQTEPNSKKAEELNQQMDELSAKLGPEYIALLGELQDMDADSEDGKQITSTLEALDKLCAKWGALAPRTRSGAV